jgi:hypothetical protein
MFVTVGIVATIAIAGYIGYTNKKRVLWKSIEFYDSIIDYCAQFQNIFRLDNISIYNGKIYINIDINNWNNIPIYLIGIRNINELYDKYSKIGVSYLLKNKKYCKIYSLENDTNADNIINDINKLKKYNKPKNELKNKSKHEIPINFVLSASYFDGTEEIDVTELLQMFDVDSKFYEKNEEITFSEILKWNNKLKLYSLQKEIYENYENEDKDKDKYVEIVNLFGEFKKFKINEVLKF